MARKKPTQKTNEVSAERQIIDTAIARLKKCIKADRHNREAAVDDLKFLNGEQWDSGEIKRRRDKNRPALTLNFLPKFVAQVTGDMLQNTPSIKVRPTDSKGDINIAKIRQGIINAIEYNSNAKGIYSYASKQLVGCGYGAWRVLTRYTEENPFLQEVYLEGIRNPFTVYLDPDATDQNFADAKYGFIICRMELEDFKREYPKAEVPGNDMSDVGMADEHWYDSETVTVAEYFEIVKEKVTIHQLEDGKVVTDEEYQDLLEDYKERKQEVLDLIEAMPITPQAPPIPASPAAPAAPASPQATSNPPVGTTGPTPPGSVGVNPMAAGAVPQQPQGGDELLKRAQMIGDKPTIAKSRESEISVVRHRTITACEILDGGKEGTKVPGRYIPLVLVKGPELNIEGKNYIYSLVRHAKDPQKLINYWNSAAAETIALAPKAPWLATPKQIEGHETAYASANVENYPVLLYNPDPEAAGAPQRQAPAQPPTAIFEQIRRGEENLKSVIGMFNSDIGAPDSRQTGAAVIAGQKPGDVGTSEFSENIARAVMHTGRIINEMIPEIYDTERDVRVRNLDDSETFMPINTTVGSALKSIKSNPEMFASIEPQKLQELTREDEDARFNDITTGKYDIIVSTGPSYATQRQESAQQLLQLTHAMPQQMAIASDLIVKNLDFKDADELAERLRKTLPPGLAKPRPGDQPPQPPPPDPAVIQAQMKLQVEQMKMESEKMKVEAEKLRAQAEMMKAQAEIVRIQSEASGKTPTPEYDPVEMVEKDRRYELDKDRLELEKARFQHDMRMEGAEFRRGLMNDARPK